MSAQERIAMKCYWHPHDVDVRAALRDFRESASSAHDSRALDCHGGAVDVEHRCPFKDAAPDICRISDYCDFSVAEHRCFLLREREAYRCHLAADIGGF
ncbi:hypothetical protein BJI69_00305 [Luteibacter rhizovicinus DSM 16549]|uniref:Uncharacterized protein n=1 Tax=Luteibacter rhizovicinus DSM 16549 TaxID=1440763 RepID=A0A0G9HDM9_9GAMM|nr:hypothetical protein BJI69_00305 [Luteibacter rhizovicinus DSM 16549]KLD67294.1 hypothetical protein Y883_08590 [Luteibacter rhizovicinus DSM 16549]KLD74743.1 hypothetical protein Y886_30960 [Xanthomonas hyacinthi DSM 19077]